MSFEFFSTAKSLKLTRHLINKMKLHRSIEQYKCADTRDSIAVGVFDGVHVGHQEVITRMVQEARKKGVRSVVFTFLNHPLTILAPAYSPPRLLTPEQQLKVFSSLGVDSVLRIQFDEDFARITPLEFVQDILARRLCAGRIFCSKDFRFGRDGEGDVHFLSSQGRQYGISVSVVPPLVRDGFLVSSTMIRQMVIEGRVEQAARMLGRPFQFPARVVRGKGIGSSHLGYPTANLQPPRGHVVPAHGVYAVVGAVDGETYPGMMNIGECPTFEKGRRTFEVHLFNFNGALQGKTLLVGFVAFMRDERKFDNESELRRQLSQDRRHALELLEPINFSNFRLLS